MVTGKLMVIFPDSDFGGMIFWFFAPPFSSWTGGFPFGFPMGFTSGVQQLMGPAAGQVRTAHPSVPHRQGARGRRGHLAPQGLVRGLRPRPQGGFGWPFTAFFKEGVHLSKTNNLWGRSIHKNSLYARWGVNPMPLQIADLGVAPSLHSAESCYLGVSLFRGLPENCGFPFGFLLNTSPTNSPSKAETPKWGRVFVLRIIFESVQRIVQRESVGHPKTYPIIWSFRGGWSKGNTNLHVGRPPIFFVV